MDAKIRMPIERHVPLRDKTTFRIGGAARYFCFARSLDDLAEGLGFARSNGLPVFILGSGSNILLDDAGFDGLVIQLGLTGLSFLPQGERMELSAAAGESFDGVAARAAREGLWGLENLSGIPGSVGGAVVQNIGAYGAALSQCLAWVDVLDLETGDASRLPNSACAFGYRESLFKHQKKIVLGAGFLLSTTPAPNLSYDDLRVRLGSTPPSLGAIRQAVLSIRRGKFPDLSKEGTAGSFFKNPIVSGRDAGALRPHAPLFFLPEAEAYKLPLAYLLDHGLHLNGLSVGGARLFERQPIVIAAHPGTSSADVRELAELVERRVFDTYGIAVEREVLVVPGQAAPLSA